MPTDMWMAQGAKSRPDVPERHQDKPGGMLTLITAIGLRINTPTAYAGLRTSGLYPQSPSVQ